MNLLDIGVDPGLSPRVARRLRVTNLLLCIGVATPILWSLPGLFAGQWLLVAYNLSASLIFAIALLSGFGAGHPAVQLALGTAFLAGHHWCVLGPEIANHAWFAPLVGVPFLVLDPASRRLAFGWAAVEALCFSLGEFEVSFMEPLVPLSDAALLVGTVINTFSAAAVLIVVVAFFAHQAAKAETALEVELDRSERLLLNVLPASIAARLKTGESPLADHHTQATVLFVDLVGFTPLSKSLPPDAVVKILSALFSAFDTLTDKAGLEKIKTIGDAYMVAAGVPVARPDHAEAAARLALDIRAATDRIARELEVELSVRIGIHSGEVVAGVIGQAKFAYDLWGDTVNVASRMESHGLAGRIQLSDSTRVALPKDLVCSRRGVVEVKGYGEVETFWLEG